MSEQTPNSSEDLTGSEPSMEDILASIRKIISEDQPLAMGSPEDMKVEPIAESVFTPADLPSDSIMDFDEADLGVAEGDSVDLNIDDVLASIGEDAAEAPVVEALAPAVLAPAVLASAVLAPAVLATETLAPESLAVPDVSMNADDDVLALLDDDDMLSFLDDDIELATDDTSKVDLAEVYMPEVDLPVAETHKALDVDVPDVSSFSDTSFDVEEDDEMSALLEDILMEPEEAALEITEVPAEAAAQDIEPNYTPITESVRVESDEDLDLVKSLMADLADDPDAMSMDEDLDAMLTIPDIEEPALETPTLEDVTFEEPAFENMGDDLEALLNDIDTPAPEAVEPEAVEEDILGDILDMTLEDQLQAQPDEILLDELLGDELLEDEGVADTVVTHDDVTAFEADNISENSEHNLSPDDALFDTVGVADMDDVPSLSDIAAAAEADAVAVEMLDDEVTFDPMLAATGIAATGIAATGFVGLAATTTDEDVLETEAVAPTPEPVFETPPHKIIPQETSMSVQALNSDVILDEVTESATAGAFAQLSTVVEDKAVFNERGPRVGDLVQEALRPMLKEWLDANLKGIVERAVAKEVKRISSGK